MTFHIDAFALHFPVETHSLTDYREAPEDHPARGHFEDDRVEPFDQEQLVVRRLARNAHALARHHARRIRHHGSQCLRGLRKSLFARTSQATHPDVGLMIEVLPSGQDVAHVSCLL